MSMIFARTIFGIACLLIGCVSGVVAFVLAIGDFNFPPRRVVGYGGRQKTREDEHHPGHVALVFLVGILFGVAGVWSLPENAKPVREKPPTLNGQGWPKA